MAGSVIDVTDLSFATEVEKATSPVFVDFWAPWCGPCRMVGPMVEKLAEKYDGKVKFVKVNIDDSPGVAEKFHISGIPALFLFKNGVVADNVVGAVPIANLENMISKHI
ncbi:MAG: thioredoxin [Candidatus Sericytochromatia bacterium]|nr:thioredoxin [Candidatus Sericytochromatia bacterium]